MTRCCRRSSIWTSFSRSPSSMRETGMPRPRRDDLGDVLLGDFLAAATRWSFCSDFVVAPASLPLQLPESARIGFRSRCARSPRRCACSSSILQLARVALQPCAAVDRAPFSFCHCALSRVGFLLQIRELPLQLVAALLARGVLFLLQAPAARSPVCMICALDLVDFRRHGIQFHLQARGRLVHEIDRLVRQKTVA